MKVLLTLATALCALAASAPGALAASVNLSTSGPLAEDQTWQLKASGNAETGTYLFVRIKPAGAPPCAANYAADTGIRIGDLTDIRVNGDFSHQANVELDEPGDRILCAWLQDSDSDKTARAATGPVPITIRSNQASIALNAPATVRTDEPLPVTATGASEVRRYLHVGLVADTGACAANWGALPSRFRSDDTAVTGAFNFSAQWTAPEPGTYRICAYVHEHDGDLNPEAVQTATLVVQETVACENARAALESARSAFSRANAKVKAARKALKKARGRRAKSRARVKLRSAMRGLERAALRSKGAQQAVANVC